MPLVLVVLVAVILSAVWITVQAARYRSDIWHHWYTVGNRDAWSGTANYTLPQTKNQLIVNAYWTGYNDYKNGHAKWQ